jgi:tRNA(Arg) A34 adenosine deaminase TadA
MSVHTIKIHKTIELSEEARKDGDEPFAAILSIPNHFDVSAQNRVVRDGLPTAHKQLSVKYDIQQIKDLMKISILYSSAEPCAMCCGAMYWSDIGHLVYGCKNERFRRELRHSNTFFNCEQYFNGMKQRIVVEGPILEEKALSILKKYF